MDPRQALLQLVVEQVDAFIACIREIVVDELRPVPVNALVDRLWAAQASIASDILVAGLGLIPDRKGSQSQPESPLTSPTPAMTPVTLGEGLAIPSSFAGSYPRHC